MSDEPDKKKPSNSSVLTTVAVSVGKALGTVARKWQHDKPSAPTAADEVPSPSPTTPSPLSESQVQRRVEEMRLPRSDQEPGPAAKKARPRATRKKTVATSAAPATSKKGKKKPRKTTSTPSS